MKLARTAAWVSATNASSVAKSGTSAARVNNPINPGAAEGDLLQAAFHELQPLLEKALAQNTKDDTAHEMAVTARGLAKAAELLAKNPKPSRADIISLHTAGDLPLPTSGAGKAWAAGPGVKSDVLHDFQALVTDPPTLRLLPLFDPDSPGTTSGGTGTYQIVYFVPVYVVYAEGHGRTNMDIAVVPAAGSPIYDPTLVISGTTRMGTSTTSSRFLVPTPAKLTQ